MQIFLLVALEPKTARVTIGPDYIFFLKQLSCSPILPTGDSSEVLVQILQASLPLSAVEMDAPLEVSCAVFQDLRSL